MLADAPGALDMNQAAAMAALRPPLRFGDERAIAARNCLHHLAEVRDRLMRCAQCGGDGVCFIGRARRQGLCRCVASEPLECGVTSALVAMAK